MKAFITGGTGFIGGYVVRRIAKAGHKLVCLVRPTSRTEEMAGPDVELIVGDVSHRDILLEGMRGCDWVIHLANVYSFWEPDPSVYWKVNVEGTRNVLECALEMGIKKVLYVSTAVVWGGPLDGAYVEETPLGPEVYSEYARSKREGNRIAWELAEKKGLPLVGLYPAAVLGAGDLKSSGMMTVDIMKHRLPATGLRNSRITFVHVRDTAEAILRAAEKEGNSGERYLIGKESITLGEYMEQVSKFAGVRLPWIALPDWAVWNLSWVLTAWADLTQNQPLWGMSLDQTRTFMRGFQCDGSKAERELGLVYTPVQTALKEHVAWVGEKFG